MKTVIPSFLKEAFDQLGQNEEGIPKPIAQLAKELYPRVVCNKLTKQVLSALANKDSLLLNAYSNLGGGIHPDVQRFFVHCSKGDQIVVHFLHESRKITLVAFFEYEYDGGIHYKRPKPFPRGFSDHNDIVESYNLIAVAKVPKGKKVRECYVLDEDHSIFSKISKDLFVTSPVY